MAETEFSLALEEDPVKRWRECIGAMQSACISMRSSCNQHAIIMRSACNQHVISMRAFEEREKRRDAARVDNRDAILGRI